MFILPKGEELLNKVKIADIIKMSAQVAERMYVKGLILVLFSIQIFMASAYSQSDSLRFDEVVDSLAASDSDFLTPSWEPKNRCEHCIEVGEPKSCVNKKVIQKSCVDPINPESDYCFNGLSINQDIGNKNLMLHLCGDDFYLPKGVRLQFGSCELGEKIITEEIKCYCQYQKADESNPLAWHCEGLVEFKF